jgi:murein DD-endopeptidase MepM/ murein hydrolase activator NlpD
LVWWKHDDAVDENGQPVLGAWTAETWPRHGHVYMELTEMPVDVSEMTEDTNTEEEPSTDAEPAALAKQAFKIVWPLGMNVRDRPSLNSNVVAEIARDSVIQVYADSRTEAEGLVWWKHDDAVDENGQSVLAAWTAETWPEKGHVYMEATDVPADTDDDTTDTTPDEEIEETGDANKKPFLVVNPFGMNVRDRPSMQSNVVGELEVNDRVEVYADSRTEADGLVWWKHDDGIGPAGQRIMGAWTAESRPERNQVYMVEIVDSGEIRQFTGDANDPFNVNDATILRLRDAMFHRLPLDTIHWVQHFGNTTFAFENGKAFGYDNYAQGLHGGIDFADRSANSDTLVPVFAGVRGKIIDPLTAFGPRKVRVQVESGIPGRTYRIIYGHLQSEAPLLAVGTEVDENTVIGHIATKSNLAAFNPPHFPLKGMTPHLHLEMRMMTGGEDYILNPLLFMPEHLRAQITGKDLDFQPWHKWQTPFDQPVIRRGEPVVGPRATG